MRLMLGEVDEVVAMIDYELSRVTDYRLLMKGLQGEASKVAVNLLMQLIDLEPYPLSAYVIKQLSKVVDDAFFAEAEMIRRYNPSVLGFVFELRMIRQHRKILPGRISLQFKRPTSDLGSLGPQSQLVSWPAKEGQVAKLARLSDLPVANSWIVPEEFNQATADLFYYHQSGHLDIFQKTQANTHDYKFANENLRRVLDHFCKKDGNGSINYYIVIPAVDIEEFWVQPGNIYDAEVLSAYDRRWTWKYINANANMTTVNSAGKVVPMKASPKPADWADTTRIAIIPFDGTFQHE
jgi:hypothetical protein